jgi:DNA-binding NarL/FixJ family response regulator
MIAAESSAHPGLSGAMRNVAVEAEDEVRRLRIEAVAQACGHVVTALAHADDELGRRRVGPAPDIVALDVMPQATDVPNAIRELRERVPDTPIVVVLPGPSSPSDLRKALKAGADGIVLDEDLERTLAPTLDAISHGQIAVPRSLREHVIRRPLSHREKQVLGLVVMGFTNRQIADRLYLAESTVKSHLSSAFGKLNARSRAEASALILDPDEGLGPGILSLTPGPAAQG